MKKTHQFDAERPFVTCLEPAHYAARETRNASQGPRLERHSKNASKEEELEMSARIALGRRLSRPAAKVLARPRELFGESIPELLLVTAVVAAVVSAVLALNGVG
jgi:hypothetical protein